MRILDSAGGCLPSPPQALLLDACLLEPQAALTAWEGWRARQALDAVDDALFRLLPLLYWNLRLAGYAGPEMPLLKGVYRRSWYAYHLLARTLEEAIATLQAASVPVIVLKGMALGRLYYPDPGARHMVDMDVLVAPEQAQAAIALLREKGWTPVLPLTRFDREVFHACALRNAQGQELDLHWRLFPDCREHEDDALFWRQAEPFTLGAQSAWTLSPAGHLLHACLHGYGWNSLHPLRWIADAHRIVQTAGGAIDWDSMLAHAQSRHLTLRLRESLAYLAHARRLPVPDAVLDALHASPLAAFERQEHRLLTRMDASSPAACQLIIFYPLKRLWCKQRRFYPRRSLAMRVLCYPAMLRREMRQERLLGLSVALWRYAKRHLRRR